MFCLPGAKTSSTGSSVQSLGHIGLAPGRRGRKGCPTFLSDVFKLHPRTKHRQDAHRIKHSRRRPYHQRPAQGPKVLRTGQVLRVISARSYPRTYVGKGQRATCQAGATKKKIYCGHCRAGWWRIPPPDPPPPTRSSKSMYVSRMLSMHGKGERE